MFSLIIFLSLSHTHTHTPRQNMWSLSSKIHLCFHLFYLTLPSANSMLMQTDDNHSLVQQKYFSL